MSIENIVSPRVIAVTGASGFVGRRLLPLLAGTSAEIRVLARNESPIFARASVVTGDLRDPQALQQLVCGADEVIHLAGVAHTYLRNAAEREAARAVNVDATRSLLQAAQRAGIKRFLYLSSAHVYAGQSGIHLNEQSPTAPDGAYAAMKLEAEDMLNDAARAGMSVAILRPCLIYGPGVRHNLRALVRAISGRRFIMVRGESTQRSMASVDTVAAAIMHLSNRPDCIGPYNIADEKPVVLERWVAHIAELLGVKAPRAMPLPLLQAAATLGSALSVLGLRSPLTRASLAKLTTPFSLNVSRLSATGFQWPQSTESVLREMIAAEIPGARGADVRS